MGGRGGQDTRQVAVGAEHQLGPLREGAGGVVGAAPLAPALPLEVLDVVHLGRPPPRRLHTTCGTSGACPAS